MSFGEEDSAILNVLEQLGFQPNAIYDVGASDGSWTRLCSNIFPGIPYLLFEPLGERDSTYRRGLQSLVNSETDSTLFTVACGETDGEASFHVSTYEFGSVGSTSILEGDVDQYETISIQVRSLDSLVKEKNLPPPDLIKMDIQGGELEALKGAEGILRSCSVLFLETWLARGYGARTPLLFELMEWLCLREFSVFDFGGQYKMGDPPVLVSQDVVFIRTDSKLGEKLNREYHDRTRN